MSRIVIISAGDIASNASEALRPDDMIIACDAGYRRCEALGIRPDVILGDFDSAPRPEYPNLIILPHVKDDTDTHYAAKLALEKGATEVLMLGALGGRRMEHTLANLSTGLWLAKQGIDVSILGEYSRLSYVIAGQPKTYTKGDYFYFSVFPLEGTTEGLCIQGAYYSLEDAVLTADFPIGVSNEFAADKIHISCRSGSLLVVETKAD